MEPSSCEGHRRRQSLLPNPRAFELAEVAVFPDLGHVADVCSVFLGAQGLDAIQTTGLFGSYLVWCQEL
ncbi:hypothetical protein MRX96_026504 [Rhipicephalus microplus]